MKTLKVNLDDLYLTDDDIVLYQQKPFTGVSVETIRGTLIGEESYRNGEKHGSTKEWYSSGVLKLEYCYTRGALDGICREWFENGKLKSERKHELGIRVYEKVWDADGNLIENYQISEEHPYYKLLMQRRRENQDKSD